MRQTYNSFANDNNDSYQLVLSVVWWVWHWHLISLLFIYLRWRSTDIWPNSDI